MPSRPPTLRPAGTKPRQQAEAERKGRIDHRSVAAAAWRGWYKLARWKRRRQAQLASEPLCRFCKAIGRLTAATVADHIIPHRGNAKLFWDGELQSLCTDCHDRHKQSIERGGSLVGADADGMPVDPHHHWR